MSLIDRILNNPILDQIGKTFLLAAVGSAIASYLALGPVTSVAALKAALVGIVVGAVSAGLHAVVNSLGAVREARKVTQ